MEGLTTRRRRRKTQLLKVHEMLSERARQTMEWHEINGDSFAALGFRPTCANVNSLGFTEFAIQASRHRPKCPVAD